jgi:hypothetical protein
MGKHHTASEKKTDAPILDTKTAAPPSQWQMPSSIGELVESTHLDSTGIKEVLNATSAQDAVIQTITHPVILAVVVGATLMLLTRR